MIARRIERAAVVGFGYMGASFALDLLDRGVRVYAHDVGDSLAGLAEAHAFRGVEIVESLESLPAADLVVLAAPVHHNLENLRAVAANPARAPLIIDLGSTKTSIVEAAEHLGVTERFVGCHPLCGSSLSGWQHAKRGIYEGQRVYVCDGSRRHESAVRMVADLWQSVGATVEYIEASEHDRLLAWTSHLPHLLSVLLAATLNEGEIDRYALGPGGRRMTELARSAPSMWSPIVADNADAIGEALEHFAQQVESLRADLRKPKRQGIDRLLDDASAWADADFGAMVRESGT